jgi:hypothetical protein
MNTGAHLLIAKLPGRFGTAPAAFSSHFTCGARSDVIRWSSCNGRPCDWSLHASPRMSHHVRSCDGRRRNRAAIRNSCEDRQGLRRTRKVLASKLRAGELMSSFTASLYVRRPYCHAATRLCTQFLRLWVKGCSSRLTNDGSRSVELDAVEGAVNER